MNEIVSFLEPNTLDYFFLLNLFIICLYLCLFNLIRWCYMPVGCTCSGGTNTVFALAFVLIMCLLHCLPPHDPCMLLVTFLSLTSVHDTPAHLYVPNSLPMACPLSPVLCKLFNIYVSVIYVVQLKCDGIISFMFAMALLHLLF